jgi:peptidyl-prolyl cis-trans isomerase C
MQHGTFLAGLLAGALSMGVVLSCQSDSNGQKAGDKKAPAGGKATKATGGQASEELDAPLATVDGVVITVGEFQDQISRQSPYIRARYTSLEQKKEFLESLVRFEVLAREAQRRGLDQDPEVIRTMKSVMVQKLMREEFDKAVPPDSVTDAEMKAYYDANIKEYVKPEEVRASAIVVQAKAAAEKIATEAQGDAGKTNKGFRELVTKYTTDEETKVRGGDLRYFNRSSKDIPKAVIEAAYGLAKTGDVSGAIDAGDGKFYVIKLTGKKNAMTKTFDDVKQQIRNKLHREKRVAAQEAFVASLKTQAKVEVNEANLAKVRIDTSQQEAADPHDHGMPDSPAAPPEDDKHDDKAGQP